MRCQPNRKRGCSMSIVLTVPDELKFMVPAINQLLCQVGQTLTRTSGNRSGHSVDYQQVECEIADGVAKLERAAHEGVLQSLDVDAPRLLIRGELYEQVGRSDGIYFTMAGPCQVFRSLYQQGGNLGGPAVDPVGLRGGGVL